MNMEEAMLSYAPELANDYKVFTKRTFKSMQDDLGPTLKDVRSDRRWARIFLNELRNNIKKERHSYVPSESAEIPYIVDEEALEKNAKTYGDRMALNWFDKLQSKIGVLEKVDVSPPSSSGDIVVTGSHAENTVRVNQHRILNISSQGTLFHQFPALIYVNGKFMSEADYKRLVRGWGVKDIVRVASKPKRQPIDPDTRPKRYKFEFKIDRPVHYPNRPNPVIGEIDHDDAKGMSEEEAWSKIYKRMSKDMLPPMNYYTRIYDPKVIAIYSWNDRPIWRATSGQPKPKTTKYVMSGKSSSKSHKVTTPTAGLYGSVD